MLKLSDFDYNLPKNLIASKPHEPRDKCGLLIFDRETKKAIHSHFNKILNLLNPGDVLVLNNTKVIPARLIGRLIVKLIGKKFDDTSILPSMEVNAKKRLGRKFKILLLKKIPLDPPLKKGEIKGDLTSPFQKRGKEEGDLIPPLKVRRGYYNSPQPPLKVKGGEGELYEVLIDGKKREVGIKIDFGRGLVGEILKSPTQPPPLKKGEGRRGIWLMKFNKSGKEFWDLVFKIGKMPVPPYVKLSAELRRDKEWYQTVYAKCAGSIAAPTAGLHFTKKLLRKLKQKSVQLEYITLHVGLGTFAPVREENIAKHKMQPEYIEISPKTAGALNKAKKEGRRIIAVGTTTTRALEAVAVCHPEPVVFCRPEPITFCHPELVSGSDRFRNKFGMTSKIFKIKSFRGEINLFIYPPYKFKFVDALITNFHLPKSTLLMMVSAFLNSDPKKSVSLIKKIYREAITKKYHFYSYGDAMFIV